MDKDKPKPLPTQCSCPTCNSIKDPYTPNRLIRSALAGAEAEIEEAGGKLQGTLHGGYIAKETAIKILRKWFKGVLE